MRCEKVFYRNSLLVARAEPKESKGFCTGYAGVGRVSIAKMITRACIGYDGKKESEISELARHCSFSYTNPMATATRPTILLLDC